VNVPSVERNKDVDLYRQLTFRLLINKILLTSVLNSIFIFW